MQSGAGTGDHTTVEQWWERTAPTLGRERIAAALLGSPTGASSLVRDRLRSAGLEPRSHVQRRMLARTIIGDESGRHLPVLLRTTLARDCAGAAWTDVARCLRDSGSGTDQAVDRLLAEAGATVAERLDAWGLNRR